MKHRNFDLENETVEIKDAPWTDFETVSLWAVMGRRYLMAYMSWSGNAKGCLTVEEETYVYNNICDGFGPGNGPDYYDWSHVRDTSWEACSTFADWLEANNKTNIREFYNQCIEFTPSLIEEGEDPIQLFQ